MAQLSKDVARDYELGTMTEHPVAAATTIFEGSAVGLAAGNARPLQAGDVFGGFAAEQADNSGGAAGAARVLAHKRGAIVLPVTGVVAGSVGAAVYASDGDTFTLDSAFNANTKVGKVSRVVGAGSAVVEFDLAH